MTDLDQTQAIDLNDLEDETDEEEDNKPIAHLKVPCQKGFPGRMFPLYEGDNLIGRQDTCSVYLPLKALSREHACIEIRGDNHMICDKNSRNRTRRGKMFLLPEVRYEIKHNDTLIFGDVNCVYLIGPQVNVGDDTGSETESESMFHTVPDEVDDEIPSDRMEVVTQKDSADEKSHVDHSDASSDMLEPTQPSIVVQENRGLSGLFSVDIKSEPICKKDQNLTVKETPAVDRSRAAFTGTLILPESESETEDELDRSDLLACPTLAIEEEKDDSLSKSLLGAATQAYPDFEEESKDDSRCLRHLNLLDAATQAYTAVIDTDEESDSSEILCETTATDIDAMVDLGPTQLYSCIEKSLPSKFKENKQERFFEKKDEEDKEELIEEENIIEKNLFMSPTLASDHRPFIPENEEESNKDSITGKGDDNNATQVFIEDEDTQVLPSFDATQKVTVEEGEKAIQVFEENQATYTFIKDITCDDDTQVFDDLPVKVKKQKANPKDPLCTEDVPTLDVTDAALCDVEVTSCKSHSRNLKNIRTTKVKSNEATLVLLEDTMPISDGGDATVAISEEATVAIDEKDENHTRNGTILASEDDATQIISTEDTFSSELPDETSLSSSSSRTAGRLRQQKDAKVEGIVTGDSGERRSRDKRGKQEKLRSDEETISHATEKVKDAPSTLNTTNRKSSRKSTISASRKRKGRISAEEASQVCGKDNDVEKEATEIPSSNLKNIENPFEQVKENLSVDAKKKTEELEPTQKFIIDVEEIEEPTQRYAANAMLNSPAFEPTNICDKALKNIQGEKVTQAVMVSVSEVAKSAFNENKANSTHKGNILSSENDAAHVFTAEETFLLELPDEKPVRRRSSRITECVRQKKDAEVDSVVVGDSKGERGTRGKRGKKVKEIFNEETVVQATEKVKDAPSTSNTTNRKSGSKSTVAACRKSKGRTSTEEASQVCGKDDDVEEEATEIPFSNLKNIENPFEQVKENLSTDAKKKTEELESTQKFIIEVEEIEEPTQRYAANDSPTFEPTLVYDMAVDELPGEESTQAYVNGKGHTDANEKIGKKEQSQRKSCRKSGNVNASRQDKTSKEKTIETTNKVIKQENGLNTDEARKAYAEDGDEEVYLPSLQGVIQKQGVKKNKRETSTSSSSKRLSRSQEKVSETPLRGNRQDECKDLDPVSDLLNLPALKQAAAEATQSHGLEEDATPPLSAYASSSPDVILNSPVFPLPSTSPLKPALACSSRKRSPSPKCVSFAQEEKKASAILKVKSTRRSLKMDLSNSREPVLIKKTKREQTSQNSEESKIAIHGESFDESKGEKGMRPNRRLRKSVADLAVNKDNGDLDKAAIVETSKRLKRGSLQLESAKTGFASKRSRRSDLSPVLNLLQNCDSETGGDKMQKSLSDELVVGVSKKRTSRIRGKTEDGKDKGTIEEETINSTINHPTEIADFENDKVQESKTGPSRRSNRSKGKQINDARAIEPGALTSSDQTTQRKMSHEKLSNILHGNHNISENSSRKSIRGKNSDVEGVTIKDSKTDNVSQDSTELPNSVTVSGNKVKTLRRRATMANDAAELAQNNQPVAQLSHLKGRATRQRAGQVENTFETEKTTASSTISSRHKESESISININTKVETSWSQNGPETAETWSKMNNGSKESKDSQQTRGKKRIAVKPTLQLHDESVTLKDTREKEESGIKSPSLRRTCFVRTKPKVMFTGITDDQGEKVLKDLGGELASSVYTCTHLVTDKVKRTVKLLCCLGRGIPIVSQTWLNSSKQSGMFLDPAPFLLQDSATEKQYKFSLQLSLSKAGLNLMLAGYKVHVTKNVKPEPQQMKDILKCAGAQYLASMPKSDDKKIIVVSCDEDKAVCSPALNAGIPVVSAEFVLTGILRQEVDVNSFRLFAAPDSGRK